MFKNFYLIFLFSMSLITSGLAMQSQNNPSRKNDWLKILRTDAFFCKSTLETASPASTFFRLSCLMEAIKNAAEYAGIMFNDNDINPITLDNGEKFFCLHVAARHGDLSLVRAYLQHNINPHKKDPDGNTPKELAEREAEQATDDQKKQDYEAIISLLENKK